MGLHHRPLDLCLHSDVTCSDMVKAVSISRVYAPKIFILGDGEISDEPI